jgi:hypothetical protein
MPHASGFMLQICFQDDGLSIAIMRGRATSSCGRRVAHGGYRTHNGRRYRIFDAGDETTHDGIAIRVARRLKAVDGIDVLSGLFIRRGVPGHVCFNNGREFVVRDMQAWMAAVGAKTVHRARFAGRERLRQKLQRLPAG